MPNSYRVKVDARRCKSCELCVPACPKKIMVITGKKNELGFKIAGCRDEALCTGCLACALVCPETAIDIVKVKKP